MMFNFPAFLALLITLFISFTFIFDFLLNYAHLVSNHNSV